MATYEGQTKDKTRSVVIHALGGVFFLNEAYSLVKRGKMGYGPEALDELMYLMDDESNPVIIMAGYIQDMEDLHVIETNEGLRWRVKVIKLQPYTDEEISDIIKEKLFNRMFFYRRGERVR